jgi:predicted aldo/keto reductase-like oxidoreductase
VRWVRPERTLAQTALRFALSLDGVSLALPSAVTLAQLDENLGALNTPALTDEELSDMRQLDACVQPPVQKRNDENSVVGETPVPAEATVGAQLPLSGVTAPHLTSQS